MFLILWISDRKFHCQSKQGCKIWVLKIGEFVTVMKYKKCLTYLMLVVAGTIIILYIFASRKSRLSKSRIFQRLGSRIKQKEVFSLINLHTTKSPQPQRNLVKNISNVKTQKNKIEEVSLLEARKKRILFWGTFYGEDSLESYCINEEKDMAFCEYSCDYSVDHDDLLESDAVVFHGRDSVTEFPPSRNPDQHWVFLMFESPDNSLQDFFQLDIIFNWTMSYRMDSDVFIPYGHFIEIGNENETDNILLQESEEPPPSSFKKLAAWAVSNCDLVTSDRKALIDELSKFMPIDIYGTCGLYQCPGKSTKQCNDPQKCYEFLGHRYKFYFAFENSLCQDYVTEKFFNSLRFGMVPIVHGPMKEAYLKLAPPNSFIHVSDYQNLKELADYLLFLDRNEKEYLKYFRWKLRYKADPVYYFQQAWCSLCSKLYITEEKHSGRKSYSDIYNWWLYKNVTKVGEDREMCSRILVSQDGTFEYL